MSAGETVNLYDQFDNPIARSIEPVRSSPAPFLITFAIITGAGLFFWAGLNFKTWTAVENPAYGVARVNNATVENWTPALKDALIEWKRALPDWKIPSPRVIADTNHVCNVSTENVPIACAVFSEYAIYIARDQSLYDHKTIMLHEIGHLLGLPHIVDDELMDPAYQGKLDKPTPLAIAMAKYELEHREAK